MIFENFAKECTRIRPALKGVLEANMKDLESVQIKNKKAFTNSMKLAMNGMSIINIMLSKFQIRPEDLDKYAANEIFHTFSVILKLANIQKIKSNLKQKNLSKNFIAEDYYLKKAIAGGFLQKTIEGDIQLVEQFMATAGLNLWLFNQTYGGALVTFF